MSTLPPPSPLGRWLAIVATVAVIATLAAAFLVMRSPSEQRQVHLDERRVEDLRRLGHAVEAYHVVHGALPRELSLVIAQPGSGLPDGDPVTGQPYEYAVIGGDRYRLCATFATDSAETDDAGMFALPREDWRHGAGRHCFERVSAARPG